jgi:hypothetical protein
VAVSVLVGKAVMFSLLGGGGMFPSCEEPEDGAGTVRFAVVGTGADVDTVPDAGSFVGCASVAMVGASKGGEASDVGVTRFL